MSPLSVEVITVIPMDTITHEMSERQEHPETQEVLATETIAQVQGLEQETVITAPLRLHQLILQEDLATVLQVWPLVDKRKLTHTLLVPIGLEGFNNLNI